MPLENLIEPSQAELLGRMKALREPTKENENEDSEKSDENQEIDLLNDDSEGGDQKSNDVDNEIDTVDEEADNLKEESSILEQDNNEGDDDEALYLDLDGSEFSLDEIRKWKESAESKKDDGLRQADYTKKTQRLSEERKEVKATTEKLQATINELEKHIESGDKIDWDELREYDPSEYLKQKELKEDKKKALSEARKQANSLLDEEKSKTIESEQAKLLQLNPEWVLNGKTTTRYNDDMKLINGYVASMGYTKNETDSIMSANHWQSILDAARFKAQKGKGEALKKKFKKAPLVTKGRSNQGVKSRLDRQIEAAEIKFKKSGRIQDAQALRKLQRKRGK